ncbi:MAG: class I SAM-dependent methyltransferase [Prolixibacteraceae bacterium]|nr:class I SAM-dependent methyltransferase [Prolixibacteraceae bacterium]
MKTLEESVATAMDVKDKGILPYLPYILQDFWEIGADPKTIISLIRKHSSGSKGLKVLDLGCGKGSVSVKIAAECGFECHGIDAIPEFIEFSKGKAAEYNVAELCKFETGDIREAIKNLSTYDVIILGAIGQVFGDYKTTFTLLVNNLKENGIIIIDEGYVEEDSDFSHIQVFSKKEILNQIESSGMEMIDMVLGHEDKQLFENYDTEYDQLAQRCLELAEKHPDKAKIFLDYIKIQEEEYENLKSGITTATMVVKRKQ